MLTSEQLAGFAGLVLSLLFTYTPGLRVWFAGLVSEAKSLTMLILIVAVAVMAFGLSCGNFLSMFACTQQGAWSVAILVFWAAVGNQTAYKLMPQPSDVQQTVAVRDMGFTNARPQKVSAPIGYRFVWRDRLGFICAAIWFLLTGAMQLIPGVAIPNVIMGLLALLAGLLILFGV